MARMRNTASREKLTYIQHPTFKHAARWIKAAGSVALRIGLTLGSRGRPAIGRGVGHRAKSMPDDGPEYGLDPSTQSGCQQMQQNNVLGHLPVQG